MRIVHQHNLSSYRFSVHEPSFSLLTAYSFLSYAILLLFMHAHYDTLYLFCTQAGEGPLARYWSQVRWHGRRTVSGSGTSGLDNCLCCGTLSLSLPLFYFSFQMYYEMYLYSSDLVKVIRLDSGCDTNGLDICGAGYNWLDEVATDWTWLQLAGSGSS